MIPKPFIRLSVLIVCFSPSPSWGNYNGFPLENPEVTGTFMEYRPASGNLSAHFHGGIDLIPRDANNIVRPVAGGELVYRRTIRDIDGSSKKDTTYSFWIDHPTDTYANLATRYLHIGKYPATEINKKHPAKHKPINEPRGKSRKVTINDTLGTIVTPHDGYGDHLHFEVRDGSTRSTADYLNPLSKLPAIDDGSVDYATADAGGLWTWTVIDNEGDYADYDVSARETTEASAIPPEDLRLLFEGFDRINEYNEPSSRLLFDYGEFSEKQRGQRKDR